MEGLEQWKKTLASLRRRAAKVETHKQQEALSNACHRAYEKLRGQGDNYRDQDGLSRRWDEVEKIRKEGLANIEKAEKRKLEEGREKLAEMRRQDASRPSSGFERELAVMRARQIGKRVV